MVAFIFGITTEANMEFKGTRKIGEKPILQA